MNCYFSSFLTSTLGITKLVRVFDMCPLATVHVAKFQLPIWCISEAGFHLCRTWTPEFLQSMRWRTYIHRPGLTLYSLLKELGVAARAVMQGSSYWQTCSSHRQIRSALIHKAKAKPFQFGYGALSLSIALAPSQTKKINHSLVLFLYAVHDLNSRLKRPGLVYANSSTEEGVKRED